MYKTHLYLKSFKPHMINIFICLRFSFLYIFKCPALVLEKMFHISPAQQAFSSFRTAWVKHDSFVLKCLVLKIYCRNMAESMHFHGRHPSVFKRILQQRTIYLMTSQIIRGVFFQLCNGNHDDNNNNNKSIETSCTLPRSQQGNIQLYSVIHTDTPLKLIIRHLFHKQCWNRLGICLTMSHY